jgi:hypothetical protein
LLQYVEVRNPFKPPGFLGFFFAFLSNNVPQSPLASMQKVGILSGMPKGVQGTPAKIPTLDVITMLEVLQIRNAKAEDNPYKLCDGKELYFHVASSGKKTWRYRFKIDARMSLEELCLPLHLALASMHKYVGPCAF